jgi:predicted nucleic acid-binding protein
MSGLILLDSGPLGMATHPLATGAALECKEWMKSLLLQGRNFGAPGIADYEVRRELLRSRKAEGIRRLNEAKILNYFFPITPEAMLKAAEFWARARNQGQPTAPDLSLDADMILAGQAACLADQGWEVVIATTNAKHLERFANARIWRDIT